MDYFFQRYRIEKKIRINLLSNNDSIQKEIRSIGFKLQKVDKMTFKYKTYLLCKKDFYVLLDEFLPKNNEVK